MYTPATFWGGGILVLSRRGFMKAGTALMALSTPAAQAIGASAKGGWSASPESYSSLLKLGALVPSMLSRVRANASPTSAVCVLGDSISHGAFAGDLYRNSWVNIFKRMINAEFEVSGYGFVPLLELGAGDTFSQDIHDVLLTSINGESIHWIPHNGSNGEYVPQGLSWRSTLVGNIISTKIPTFQRVVLVWYIGMPGGGTFDVKVNGEIVAAVDTDASVRQPFNYIAVQALDDGSGSCKVECITTSAGIVELCGFSYVAKEGELVVNNFSNSGRRLRWLDENAIARLMSGSAMFICALGYNDSGENSKKGTYYAEFKKRIDWIVKYSIAYDVPVIVPDFVWNKPGNDVTRRQLQRLAKQTNGVYIPFPDMFNKFGEFSSDKYRIHDLKMFSDGAHPGVLGHQYIAEVVSKCLGLTCGSKKIALQQYDWWMPIALSATGITNAGTNSDTVTAVRNSGKNRADLRVYVNGITGATTRGMWASWPVRAGIRQSFALPSIPLQQKTDGTSRGTFTILAGGESTANPNAYNDISQHFMFTSFPTAD